MVFHLLSNEDPQALRQLKRGLLGLLAEAQTRLGFFPASRRMLIEVYPDEQGGATVYFCADPPPGEEPESFCFSDADSLIEAATRLVPLCGHRLCSLPLPGTLVAGHPPDGRPRQRRRKAAGGIRLPQLGGRVRRRRH